MFKNLCILLIGVALGVGGLWLKLSFDDLKAENILLKQHLETDKNDLERPASDQHWFQEKLDQVSESGASEFSKLESEGDDSAELFQKFTSPRGAESSDVVR